MRPFPENRGDRFVLTIGHIGAFPEHLHTEPEIYTPLHGQAAA